MNEHTDQHVRDEHKSAGEPLAGVQARRETPIDDDMSADDSEASRGDVDLDADRSETSGGDRS